MHMHIKNMHILDISSLNNLHVFFSDETKDRPGDQKSKKNNDGWLETGRNEDEAEANADQDVWPVWRHLFFGKYKMYLILSSLPAGESALVKMCPVFPWLSWRTNCLTSPTPETEYVDLFIDVNRFKDRFTLISFHQSLAMETTVRRATPM